MQFNSFPKLENKGTMEADDSLKDEPSKKTLERQMNQGIPAVLSNVECEQFLSQPGFFRALRGYNEAAFSLIYKKALENASYLIVNESNSPDAEKITAGRVNLVAQIVRELDADPVRLEITPPTGVAKLSYWERKHAEKNFTCWNSMIKLLSSKSLQGDDWLTVFTGLANSVEGKERDLGMPLVNAALRRPDIAVQAIESFPKLFRSARGKEAEDTALMKIARGDTRACLCEYESASGQPGAAVEIGAKIVRALQAAKVKESGSVLLFQASMADHWKVHQASIKVVFDIFCATHGIEKVLDSQNSDGTPTLKWAILNVSPSAADANRQHVSGHLLDLGFGKIVDSRPDEETQRALGVALRTLPKTAQSLHDFSRRGLVSHDQLIELSSDLAAIRDPESRAYIASRHALMEIESMLASQENKSNKISKL